MTAPIKEGYVPMPRPANAVKARTATEFVEYRPSSVYDDQLAKCRAYRATGRSWKPEGAK